MKILFVCSGNVARSQIAMELFRKYNLNKDIITDSAGLNVNECENHKIKDTRDTENVILFMKKENIDITNNIRKQITTKLIQENDKIIVLLEKNKVPKEFLDNSKFEIWNVEDPKNKNDDFLEETIVQIKLELYKFFEKENIKHNTIWH